ncbi:MAG: PEGA domain-containing protein [Kiritimatiellia bacterium]
MHPDPRTVSPYIYALGLFTLLGLPAIAAVQIETDPPSAHIRVNTTRAGISPARVILQPGTYLVTATLNGYYTAFAHLTTTDEPQSGTRHHCHARSAATARISRHHARMETGSLEPGKYRATFRPRSIPTPTSMTTD